MGILMIGVLLLLYLDSLGDGLEAESIAILIMVILALVLT